MLVGENPLPNYVAARTLLKEGGTVYLVHSTDTTSRADCLKSNLQSIKIEKIPLGNKETNSQYIRNKIQEKVEEILQKSDGKQTFGLNYTGGTKAMSVHSYRALFDVDKVDNPVFSYLDARNLQMLIDRENDAPIFEKIKLKVKLKELFNLHDLPWKKHKQPNRQPILPDVAEEFLNVFLSPTSKKTDSIAKQWWIWCTNELYPSTKDSYGFWFDEAELSQAPEISLEGVPEKIKQILYASNFVNYNDKLDLKLSKNNGFHEISDFCAWLSGIWLEHYILHQVQMISQNFASIHESAMSFHIDDPNNRDDRYDRFEFDVAFMHNYQLFALSCTTAGEKSICKQKLFEAHLRARQLGGDEARVALVCFHKNSDRVKRDLEATVKDKKIAVFGCKELKSDKFAKKMQQWIRDNS